MSDERRDTTERRDHERRADKDRRVEHTDPTTGLLRQMLVDNDEKHEKAHKRLRGDWREHDRRLEALEGDHGDMRATLRNIERSLKEPRTTDVSTLRLTPGQTAVVVVACLSLGGMMLQLTLMKTSIDTLQQKATMQELKMNSLEITIAGKRSQP